MKKVLGAMLIGLAAVLAGGAAEASYVDTTNILYKDNPDLKLTDDYGRLETTYAFSAEAKGFPFTVPRAFRWRLDPGPLLQMNLSSFQRAWRAGAGEDELLPPFRQLPAGVFPWNLQFTGPNPAARFLGYYAADSIWTPFTYPGKAYYALAYPEYRLSWSLSGVISIPIGDSGTITVNPDDALPENSGNPQHQGTGGVARPWEPVCKDSDRRFSVPDRKCVCKVGTPADRPDCRPGAGCAQPGRMTRIDGKCTCLPDYPHAVRVGARLISCHTDQEHAERQNGASHDWFIRGESDWLNGWRAALNCESTDDSGIFDTNTPFSELEIGCDVRGIQRPLSAPTASQGSNPGPRAACFNAANMDGWVLCEHDPRPNEPFEMPYLNFRASFEVCSGAGAPEWCRRINPDRPPFDPADPDRPADLRVPFAGYQPGSPAAGDELELQLTLTNEGFEVAESHHYRVTLQKPDGSTETLTRYAGSLGPGRSRYLTVRGEELGYPELSDGPHTVTFEVDSQGEVAEWIEDNNTFTLNFEVGDNPAASDPDLRVTSLRTVDSNPASGQPLGLNVTVTNVGGSTASNSLAAVVVVGGSGEVFSETVAIDSLLPMESETFRYTTEEVVLAGTLQIAVIADHGLEISESNEDNNLAERNVTVHDSHLDCLPCTSGSPNDVGAQMCQDGTEGPEPGLYHVCRGVRSDGTTCANDPNNPNGWEFVGPQCPPADTLPEGWHPNACGEPDVCLGTAEP